MYFGGELTPAFTLCALALQYDRCAGVNVHYIGQTSSSCYDTNGGALDSGSDSCRWYYGQELRCGDFDDSNFVASTMCCACGGGCFNTNGAALDSGLDGCTYYNGSSSGPAGNTRSSCGIFDDSNFDASDMCCGCGGGCTNTNGVALDSGFDNCNWYIGSTSLCGSFDDSNFVAATMCCACGGGSRAGQSPNPSPTSPPTNGASAIQSSFGVVVMGLVLACGLHTHLPRP